MYNKFGRVRNQIIHFAIPDTSLSDLTLEYTFKIIEKAINNWWDTTILDYAQDYDDQILENIFERLEDLELTLNYTVDENYNLIKK
ncbi:MAG: hypothetical protein PHW92_11180 [Lutibacter sp.]|nr:hypothetical protein [Lutibacter sp.]